MDVKAASLRLERQRFQCGRDCDKGQAECLADHGEYLHRHCYKEQLTCTVSALRAYHKKQLRIYKECLLLRFDLES
jgi:hypothetical protein